MTSAQQLWNSPPFGAEGGIQTSGDAIAATIDGVSLEAVWDEVREIITAWNASRDALTSVLAYSTTLVAEAIPQSQSLDDFEPASEFGQPESLRPPADYTLMGFDLHDFDKASRWTRFALRDSTKAQILATLNYALEADNRLVNAAILHALFSNEARENEQGHVVHSLYNGDGMVPPAYLGKNFTSGHDHYLTSGAAVIDSGDLETLAKLVAEHGFGTQPGAQLLTLMHPDQFEAVSTFKAGEESAAGVIAKHSFIPSQGAPAYYSPEEIVGQPAPATYQKLKIEGSYGSTWIVQSDHLPADYLSVVASYGANSPANAIAVRQHPNPQYQGFRVIPGHGEFPIQDSFYTRAFGTGVRRRGQAACMKITEDDTYAPPQIFGYVQP